MSIIIRFASFDKINSHFQQLSQSMKEVARDTARALIIRAENLAKERVLSATRKPYIGKGNYFRSIKSEFENGNGIYIGKLGSNAPIAGIIEFGSRPHVIRSRGNKFLFWPGAKHPAKQVKHPGTPAFRVLGDATEEAVGDAGVIFESVVKHKFNSGDIW